LNKRGELFIIEEEKKEDFDEDFELRLKLEELDRKVDELEQAEAAYKKEIRERQGRVYQPNAPGKASIRQPVLLEEIKSNDRIPDIDYDRDIFGQLCTKNERKNRNKQNHNAQFIENQWESTPTKA